MSLRLRQTIAGRPTVTSAQGCDVLTAGDRGLIAYPSGSNVVILDHDLELADTLEFWKALPYRIASSSASSVQGVSCSTLSVLILAWSDIHLVIWQHRLQEGTGWAVHSTLVASAPITCVDFAKGLLLLGSRNGIEAWRMDPSTEVVVWDRLWERSCPTPSSICVSPSLSHVAWSRDNDKSAHVLGLDRQSAAIGMPQELRHPREIQWIGWRKPKSASGDAHLYTITTNSVFRIYSPVLDDPSWFQLLSTVDSRSFAPADGKGKQASSAGGTMWAMDAGVLRAALVITLSDTTNAKQRISADVMKTLTSLESEETDLLAWIGINGTFAVRSIVNMDRRPPTLLKSLPVARMQICNVGGLEWHSHTQLLFDPATSGLLAISASTSNDTILAYSISLVNLLSSKPSSVSPISRDASEKETKSVQLKHPIDHFVRTPNGRGLLAVGEEGEIGVWYKAHLHSPPVNQRGTKALLGKGYWIGPQQIRRCAIFSKGRAIVSFVQKEDGKSVIQLQHIDPGSSTPAHPVVLPDFSMESDDDLEMLLAVSDIDDGFNGEGRKTQHAYIMAASGKGTAWIWRTESPTIERSSVPPTISLISRYTLSVEGSRSHLILPVDPMGWHQNVIDWATNTPMQDMLVTLSGEGVLEFWTPHLHQHKAPEANGTTTGVLNPHQDPEDDWTRTGLVRTGKGNVLAARCSSRKKTVLVCALSDGSHEMTIWDSKVSDFSTGLELTHVFPSGEIVQDLDWTTTSDLQSVLAVGFPHKIVLVCEQRMSYIESNPGWAPFLTVDMTQYTSVPINDSIWLAGGSLAVGAGNQMYLFSRWLDREVTKSSGASGRSMGSEGEEPEDIFQLIAKENGPLWDYHPTLLAQCLLWNKIDLVKEILVSLVISLRDAEGNKRKRARFQRLEPSRFYTTEMKGSHHKTLSIRKYDGLFQTDSPDSISDEDEFNSRLVDDLIDNLNGPISLSLSHTEKSMLATVAQATLEVERQRRSLDVCGLRYLISIRMFVNQNRRAGVSGTATPASSGAATPGGHPSQRSRLSFRNIVWATHSESHEILLTAATECCENGKMLWPDAKRLGVFLWLSSNETIRKQLEVIARNRFMADEKRDPTACSLLFFALGKKTIVHGLWRQAYQHKEQQMMLKFLANDFELERWKTAAMKNAYALLSKQRYEYAAAFFMLAGNPKDAINICLRQLNDWQLAVALARVVEGGSDGPILRSVLSDTVVPTAFAGGHRWLATWAFWLLGKRDLAVRVLISPMKEVASAWSPAKDLPVGISENDDPSLLLLFQHLKSKSLQTAKGTSEIPEKTEFDFVLHNARVFFRMGCHSLALDLLRSWSFARPFFPVKRSLIRVNGPSTPESATPTIPNHVRRPSLESISRPRRPSFMLASHNRHESMVMDIDVLAETSEPVSRVATPPMPMEENENENEKEEEKEKEGPKKVGNLMKELKQDVQQGGMEFNMDSFF